MCSPCIIERPELDSSGSGRGKVASSCTRKSTVNKCKSDAHWSYRNGQILCKPTYGPYYMSPALTLPERHLHIFEEDLILFLQHNSTTRGNYTANYIWQYFGIHRQIPERTTCKELLFLNTSFRIYRSRHTTYIFHVYINLL